MIISSIIGIIVGLISSVISYKLSISFASNFGGPANTPGGDIVAGVILIVLLIILTPLISISLSLAVKKILNYIKLDIKKSYTASIAVIVAIISMFLVYFGIYNNIVRPAIFGNSKTGCDIMKDGKTKYYCYLNNARDGNDPNICKSLGAERAINSCYAEVASYNNYAYCGLISDDYTKKRCYMNIVKSKKNLSICESLPDKTKCFEEFFLYSLPMNNYISKNVCNTTTSENDKNLCIDKRYAVAEDRYLWVLWYVQTELEKNSFTIDDITNGKFGRVTKNEVRGRALLWLEQNGFVVKNGDRYFPTGKNPQKKAGL